MLNLRDFLYKSCNEPIPIPRVGKLFATAWWNDALHSPRTMLTMDERLHYTAKTMYEGEYDRAYTR